MNKYKGGYTYIPLIETPGVAFITYQESPQEGPETMGDAVLGCWPVLLVTSLMAYMAGCTMWILVSGIARAQNRERGSRYWGGAA